jgi:hypothetical protein
VHVSNRTIDLVPNFVFVRVFGHVRANFYHHLRISFTDGFLLVRVVHEVETTTTTRVVVVPPPFGEPETLITFQHQSHFRHPSRYFPDSAFRLSFFVFFFVFIIRDITDIHRPIVSLSFELRL